jgi:uncharacterized membrane protein YbhN (UPF0104 family)
MNVFASRRYLPLQIAFWLLPIAGVVWWATQQSAPTLPDTTGGFAELLTALAIYALATVARGERWHAILIAEGVEVSRTETQSLTVVGYMGNNALPARAGELLRVFLLHSRTGTSRRTVLGSILVERLLDAMALGILLVALAWNLADNLRAPSTALIIAAVAVVVLLITIAGVTLYRSPDLRARLRHGIVPLLTPAKQLLSWRGVVLLIASLAIWTTEAAVYMLVAEAVGVHLGLHGGLSVVAFTNLCALIPAAPGYIGTYDAAVLFGVKAVSNTAGKAALSYLLLLRFVLFIPITIVGLIVLFARYGGLSRLRAARAERMSEQPVTS